MSFGIVGTTMIGFLHSMEFFDAGQGLRMMKPVWKMIHLFALDEPEAVVDASGKLLVFFGIALSGREFVAGIATAIFGQIAVSLNDRPQTIGEAIKRLVGTILCAFFAAMACGLPIVKSFPPVIVMGMAGALSMTIIKILDAFKRKADSKADQAADKILDNVKDRFGG